MTNIPKSNKKNIVWINDEFIEQSKANLPHIERGPLKATGLFETLRIDNGCIHFLKEHLERLSKSAKYFKVIMPSIKWEQIIEQLLKDNSLEESIVRLKIVLTSKRILNPHISGNDDKTIIVCCDEYMPPTPEIYGIGWRLNSFDTHCASVSGKHKLLDLTYLFDAHRLSNFECFDDAIIFDEKGWVAETSICSLLYLFEDSWFTPKSDYQLPGIALKSVTKIMEKMGADVTGRATSISDLLASDAVFALNSLIGVMPIRGINDNDVKDIDPAFGKYLRKNLFSCKV